MPQTVFFIVLGTIAFLLLFSLIVIILRRNRVINGVNIFVRILCSLTIIFGVLCCFAVLLMFKPFNGFYIDLDLAILVTGEKSLKLLSPQILKPFYDYYYLLPAVTVLSIVVLILDCSKFKNKNKQKTSQNQTLVFEQDNIAKRQTNDFAVQASVADKVSVNAFEKDEKTFAPQPLYQKPDNIIIDDTYDDEELILDEDEADETEDVEIEDFDDQELEFEILKKYLDEAELNQDDEWFTDGQAFDIPRDNYIPKIKTIAKPVNYSSRANEPALTNRQKNSPAFRQGIKELSEMLLQSLKKLEQVQEEEFNSEPDFEQIVQEIVIKESVQKPVVELTVKESAQKLTAQRTIKEPAQKPVARRTAKEPVQISVEERTVKEPVQKPVAKRVAKESVQKPAARRIAKEPVQISVEERTVKEPIKRPVAKRAAKESVQRPVAERTVKEPVQKPATERTAKEPVQKPATERTVKEPIKRPATERTVKESIKIQQEPVKKPLERSIKNTTGQAIRKRNTNTSLPVTRRAVLINRHSAVNMFAEYLNNKDDTEKIQLEKSINTIKL